MDTNNINQQIICLDAIDALIDRGWITAGLATVNAIDTNFLQLANQIAGMPLDVEVRTVREWIEDRHIDRLIAQLACCNWTWSMEYVLATLLESDGIDVLTEVVDQVHALLYDVLELPKQARAALENDEMQDRERGTLELVGLLMGMSDHWTWDRVPISQ